MHYGIYTQVLIVYLLVINIIALTLYGLDKSLAKHAGARRIRERDLLLLAVVGGSPGALAGMWLFRHKTRHLKFKLGVPLIMVLQILAVFYFYNR